MPPIFWIASWVTWTTVCMEEVPSWDPARRRGRAAPCKSRRLMPLSVRWRPSHNRHGRRGRHRRRRRGIAAPAGARRSPGCRATSPRAAVIPGVGAKGERAGGAGSVPAPRGKSVERGYRTPAALPAGHLRRPDGRAAAGHRAARFADLTLEGRLLRRVRRVLLLDQLLDPADLALVRGGSRVGQLLIQLFQLRGVPLLLLLELGPRV